MDIWFSLFVGLVAVVVALGGTLALVGYMNVLPMAFAAGKRWLMALAVIPIAIVALPAAAIFIVTPFFPDIVPGGQVARWLAVPAGILHVVVLARFLMLHWQDNAKGGKQLLAGLLLLAVAGGLVLGFGPFFAERAVAGVK